MKNKDLDKQSKYIRKVVLDMLAQSGRGHLASAFSITEILLVLYNHILKYRPNDPQWLNRDRFILSKGQGCLSYYAILAEKGFFRKEKLTSFSSLIIDKVIGIVQTIPLSNLLLFKTLS